MVLLITEKVRPSLRGELSRWLMEITHGVFLGKVSATVRDHLWDRACDKLGVGGAMLVHPWPNEQGFLIRQAGILSREIVDLDGLLLVRKLHGRRPKGREPGEENVNT